MPSAAMLSRSEGVTAIRGWVGTPYRLGARVQGAGVDCCTLLCEHLIQIGLADREELYSGLGLYSADWFLHAPTERYLRGLMRFGTTVAGGICRGGAGAQPGDIALFKVARSRLFNHGAIVTAWPLGVHAQADGVREVDLVACPLTSFRKMELFDPFGTPNG
jgi:cell wall-associated NlpC family hydrolase